MAIDIDEALARFTTEPPHSGLDGMEGRVLDAIARKPMTSGGHLTLSITLALIVGVAGSVVQQTRDQSEIAPLTLGGTNPLAPSTLLGGS